MDKQKRLGVSCASHSARCAECTLPATVLPGGDEGWLSTMPGQTEVAIDGEKFLINGKPAYAGREYRGYRIEGLLLNARMVQGIFDDENPDTRGLWAYPDTGLWDPERNTREFIAAMPSWRACGLLAFTLNLQGGSPMGYSSVAATQQALQELRARTGDRRPVPEPATAQPWHNSAFTSTGELKPAYLARLRRILDAADQLGMVVILGYFYQGQDERLVDEAAVCCAVDSITAWLLEEGYTNVLVEVNNECDTRYEHEILQPQRVHELIRRVRAQTHRGRRLLAGTSYRGGRIPDEQVVAASDFVLLHGNGVSDPARIAEMVDRTRALPAFRPMPVLFNEDDHYDFDRPYNNMLVALSRYASWGYFDPGEGAGGRSARGNYRDGFQNVPVNWTINTERKRQFFALVQAVTEGAA